MRNRRKFQPPMTTWYAAMLFAVMPLRNGLPDSPPIGSWIDVTVTLWVIAVLAAETFPPTQRRLPWISRRDHGRRVKASIWHGRTMVK